MMTIRSTEVWSHALALPSLLFLLRTYAFRKLSYAQESVLFERYIIINNVFQ